MLSDVPPFRGEGSGKDSTHLGLPKRLLQPKTPPCHWYSKCIWLYVKKVNSSKRIPIGYNSMFGYPALTHSHILLWHVDHSLACAGLRNVLFFLCSSPSTTVPPIGWQGERPTSPKGTSRHLCLRWTRWTMRRRIMRSSMSHGFCFFAFTYKQRPPTPQTCDPCYFWTKIVSNKYQIKLWNLPAVAQSRWTLSLPPGPAGSPARHKHWDVPCEARLKAIDLGVKSPPTKTNLTKT